MRRKSRSKKVTRTKSTPRKTTRAKSARKKATRSKARRIKSSPRRTAKACGMMGGAPVKLPPGFEEAPESRIAVPKGVLKPVPSSKLRTGLQRASKEINKIVSDLVEINKAEYTIQEIEFTLSFTADGKFMGIGVGGATSLKVKIRPE